MARDLLDLLWRDHPGAPRRGARGPQPKVTTSDAVSAAIALADRDGLAAVTVRRLAVDLDVAPMSLYTYVGPHEDLLVLMADQVNAEMARPSFGRRGWRARVRAVAEANRRLSLEHPWLLDVGDQRVALGPGTIAKYDYELGAVEPLGLDDVDTDAALTFVLDFARAAARARREVDAGPAIAAAWATWSVRLATYLGRDHPRAQRVGAAAGAAMEAAYSPEHAWTFGLGRVLAALESLPTPATAKERA